MSETTILKSENLDLFYGDHQALKSISIEIPEKEITALIGPSGCGKSTFMKTINRMNDLVPGVTIRGKMLYRDMDIYGNGVNVTWLRKRIGMVFQKPNPFQGPPEKICVGPVRRPAAASVHCQSSGGGAGHPADGRGHLGPGPHFDLQD